MDIAFEKLKSILVDQLGCEEEDVTTDASLVDDLGADDFDLSKIISAVEKEFDIVILDSEAENLDTVGDFVDYITDCLA